MGHYQETWLLGPACLADLTGSGPRPSEPPCFYTEVLILLLPSSCSLFQGLHPSPRLLQRAHVRHSFPESTAGLGHVQCPAWVPFPAPRPWGSPLPSPALTSPPINGALGQILKHHSRLAAPAQRQTRPCTYVCLQMTRGRRCWVQSFRLCLHQVTQCLPSLVTPWWQGRFCTVFISQTYTYQTPTAHLAPGWALKPRKVSLRV